MVAPTAQPMIPTVSPAQRETMQAAVIAGPGFETLRPALAREPPHDVAVGVEDADRRHVRRRQPLLPAAPRAPVPPA